MELIKAQLVDSGTAVAEHVTPDDGVTIYVHTFRGNDSSSAKASCKLVWDYDGTPEVLWIINEGSEMPFSLRREADGVKKLAIVLDNSCDSDYNMSAYCEYEEE